MLRDSPGLIISTERRLMLVRDVSTSSGRPAPKRPNEHSTPQLSKRRVAAGIRDCFVGLPLWSWYRLIKPRTIVVLGMHRSGTSYLTRMVNLCGASLGGAVA